MVKDELIVRMLERISSSSTHHSQPLTHVPHSMHLHTFQLFRSGSTIVKTLHHVSQQLWSPGVIAAWRYKKARINGVGNLL